jgi:hypothetical protein
LDITRITGNLPITRVSGMGGFTTITDGLKLFSSQQYLNYKLLIGNPALGDGNNKFAACIMTRAQNEYSRANLCFCVAPPSLSNTSASADIGNVRIEIKDSSFIEFNGNSATGSVDNSYSILSIGDEDSQSLIDGTFESKRINKPTRQSCSADPSLVHQRIHLQSSEYSWIIFS